MTGWLCTFVLALWMFTAAAWVGAGWAAFALGWIGVGSGFHAWKSWYGFREEAAGE